MSDYPEDFAIASLRGRSRLQPTDVRKELRRRIAWLEYKVSTSELDAKPMLFWKNELKALVAALEVYEVTYPPGPKPEATAEELTP